MRKFNITVNGQSYEVEVNEAGVVSATKAAAPAPVAAPAAPAPVAVPAPAAPKAAPAAGDTPIIAPMPGKVLEIRVKEGATVKRGDVVLILEAMKMQNEIMSPADGTIKAINTSAGASVASGDVMIIVG